MKNSKKTLKFFSNNTKIQKINKTDKSKIKGGTIDDLDLI